MKKKGGGGGGGGVPPTATLYIPEMHDQICNSEQELIFQGMQFRCNLIKVTVFSEEIKCEKQHHVLLKKYVYSA